MRRKPRRRWRFWLLAALGLFAGLFGLLQWVLSTPWACRRVASKVEARLGLETHIERLSWSPWGGAVVHGLTVAKPDGLDERPLITVEEARVWPDYSAWLRGRRTIRGAELIGPELELDAELLLSIASTALQAAPEPPVIAAADGGEAETISSPGSAGRPSPAPGPGVQGDGVPSSQVPLEGEPSPAGEVSWLTVRGGGFRIVGFGLPGEWLQCEGFNGAVPLLGSGTGTITGVADSSLLVDGKSTVSMRLKKSPDRIADVVLKVAGENHVTHVEAKIRVTSGLPIQTKASISISSPLEWRFDSGLGGEMAPSVMRVEGFGWLAYPSTWTARAEAKGAGLGLWREGWGEWVFDAASGQVLLSRGRIRCPGFRLMGEPVSLQGNGWLGKGSGALVARVSLPEAHAAVVGTRIGPVAWRPLAPGSPVYADVTVWSDEDGRWWVELGDGGERLAFEEWSERLRNGTGVGR